jgi:hypothetical protein
MNIFAIMAILGAALIIFGLVIVRNEKVSTWFIIIGVPMFLIGFWFVVGPEIYKWFVSR